MSCSKIFSGDLPELAYEVIKYFRNDKSTLHSCILVNRLWCRLAIPLLWEDPFSFRTVICNFIGIYLNNLNDDDLKSKLNKHIINNNSLPSNTLFNYIRFLKYLNIFDIISCVEMWFTIKKSELRNNNYSATEFKRLIGISLFKIFIENEVNLHTFEIEIPSTYYYTYFNDILEIILQNTNFIQNIRNLNLYVNSSIRFSHDIINNEYIHIFYQIFNIPNLIENIKQNLNYLSINLCEDIYLSDDNISILLRNLGQTLPSKLEYLSLVLNIKENDFRIFLENSQNIFINKLKIMQNSSDNILHNVKEYIMKEKRVKFLAIWDFKNGDLSRLKNEVKEFNLYNIKVLNYHDLSLAFDVYSLLKKIDYL
ncbi:unnamed protein product [Rhizophagus irregularis]|nr:unnamed protein product [Rhizophagus irregularis]